MKTMSFPLKLRITDNAVIAVNIWTQPVPGLAIHHNIVWVTSAQQFTFSPQWTVSHIPSGKILLPNAVGVNYQSDAKSICEKLAPLGDWTQNSPPSVSRAVMMDIMDLGGSPGIGEVASDAPEPSPRFVIEPIEGGLGYKIVDTNTGHVIEDTFYHRGLAAQAATDLNNQKG